VILYLVLLASLPVCLLFSVTFYVDVPMSAQALTAFYLLSRRKNGLATLFMILAIGIKISALLFLPAFFGLMLVWEVQAKRRVWGLLTVALSATLVFAGTWAMGKTFRVHHDVPMFHEMRIRDLVKSFTGSNRKKPIGQKKADTGTAEAQQKRRIKFDTDANRPGNLKVPQNYLIYGGVLLWVMILMWLAAAAYLWRRGPPEKSGEPSGAWLWVTGLSYLFIAAVLLRHAPDARHFLPGIAFVLLPMIEKVVRLPKSKILIALITSLAILQSGYVLARTYQARKVPATIEAAIQFLKKNPPDPPRIFMYPEGNHLLFPVPAEWYFNWHLREFWGADNDGRLQMLHQYYVGAVVIKKDRISQTGREPVSLGAYPVHFVNALKNDPRFERIFENEGVIIYRVPPNPAARD
jgi:hypothetical protein